MNDRGSGIFAGFVSLLIFVLVVGIIFFFSVSKFTTAPDQAGLHYASGPFSSTKYAEYIPPGTRVWNGPADKHYAYPAGQRTFAFGNRGETDTQNGDATVSDASAFKVTTSDPIELSVSGVVTFQLDTSEAKLRKFHEQIGLKYQAYMAGTQTRKGWNDMLAVYLEQPLQRALNEATQGVSWEELYNNPTTRAAWEKTVKEKLPAYVTQAMGDDYFINFSVTLQKPDIPSELKSALEDKQVAIQQNEAQKERNAKIITETDSIKALVAILGVDGYNTYKAIEEGKVTVFPIPQGSDVIVGGNGATAPVTPDSDDS